MDMLENTVKELDHIVRGVDGNNGLRQRLKALEEKVDVNRKETMEKIESLEKNITNKFEEINRTLYMFIGGLILLNIVISLFKDQLFG